LELCSKIFFEVAAGYMVIVILGHYANSYGLYYGRPCKQSFCIRCLNSIKKASMK
jgi:hypothetical protein